MTRHHDDRLPAGDGSPAERFEALLAESGIASDDALLSALAELEALGAGDPPAPSPALSALLEPSHAAQRTPSRRGPGSRRARIAIASLTAAACLSAGGVAAAAVGNHAFRHSVGHTIAAVVGTLAGARHVVQSPREGAPELGASPAPAPQGSPTTARVVSPDTPRPTWTPESGSPSGRESLPSQPALLRVEHSTGTPSTLPSRTISVPAIPSHSPDRGTPSSGPSHPSEPGRTAGPRDPHSSPTSQPRP